MCVRRSRQQAVSGVELKGRGDLNTAVLPGWLSASTMEYLPPLPHSSISTLPPTPPRTLAQRGKILHFCQPPSAPFLYSRSGCISRRLASFLFFPMTSCRPPLVVRSNPKAINQLVVFFVQTASRPLGWPSPPPHFSLIPPVFNVDCHPWGWNKIYLHSTKTKQDTVVLFLLGTHNATATAGHKWKVMVWRMNNWGLKKRILTL